MILDDFIMKNDIENVKELLKNESTVISKSNFEYACKRNYSKIVKLFLEHQNFHIYDSQKYINLCVLRGNIEALEILLTHHKSKSYYTFERILLSAVGYGKLKLVSYILNNKSCDPSQNRNRLIIDAYEKEYNEITEMLWKDDRVKNSLNQDNQKIYKELLKLYVAEKINNF